MVNKIDWNNKEERKEHHREYSQRPEVKARIRKYDKQYRQDNKEKIKAQQREYYKKYYLKSEVKIRKNEYSKQYYQKNKEKMNIKRKEHYKKNKDKKKELLFNNNCVDCGKTIKNCSTRCYSCSNIKENNPNWQGGKSFEPYGLDFNNKFKEAIRERDNHCCVICNKPQEELKCKLHIHHIDYDKTNNLPPNCVSLCIIHHGETNVNRSAWKSFFQQLLKEREHYQYTEDNKIILDFTKGEK